MILDFFAIIFRRNEFRKHSKFASEIGHGCFFNPMQEFVPTFSYPLEFPSQILELCLVVVTLKSE